MNRIIKLIVFLLLATPSVVPQESKYIESSLIPECNGLKCGYRDETGKMVIEAKFDDVRPFSDGLAFIEVIKDGYHQCGYIDHTGKIVIEPRFSSCEDFSVEFKGLAKVYLQGNWHYINKSGKIIYQGGKIED